MASIQEAIRIVLETEGREGLELLRKALAGVGDVSADTVADTDRLLDSLAGLNEAAAKATRFEQLSTELAATEKSLDDASRAALQMALQLGATEKPSKHMLRTFKEVRDEVTKLEGVQRQQAAAQRRIGAELREAGFDTAALADANRGLRTQVQSATQSLQQQVRTVEQQAAASRRQRDATEEADEAFRKMARSGQASAEALREYRDRADQATRGTRELGGEAGRVGGIFGRLRGLVAPVLAFLGIREAAQGAKNLAGVAAEAENARRALQNLYGSQAEGNRAYETLRTLSKENGIAFDVLVESAKKLKAFGLDPLNGSMQALVDQNASVGGSNEDLAGKVLALGQAWAKQKLQGEEILQLVERGVPVWDLLQKATGKNVQELQKLSEQGKLGRGVIKALYEEIGKANDGKANEALTSTSGLIEQMSARWVGFKQRIVDAGLGDYFKQQMQTLLQSTGGLDGLAQRVSAGIVGTLEALKTLGQQLAIIAQPIANTAVAIARHADAVVLLGKVYVGLKLTQFASQFAGLAASMGTATAATGALTAAETVRATGVGRLGGIMAKIPRVLTVGFAAVGLDVMLNGIDRLNEGLKARSEGIVAGDRLWAASAQLQMEQWRLGKQLQDLYRNFSDVAVQSGANVSAMTRAQAQDYQYALEQARQYFAGIIREARAAHDAQKEATATERWKALGAAVVAAKDRITDLVRTASADTSLGKMADAAVLKFDALIAKTKSAKEAVNDIFKGVDLTRADGLKQALDILDQVNARGTAAAAAIKAELRTALAAVADEDLPKLKAAADQAFASGSAGAKQFAAEIGRIGLSRLGVDVEAIKTGFSEVGRVAVDNFKLAIREIDSLGLTMEQRSTAIAQAFDNAFKQASTKAELGALKVALQDALSSGDIGFKEFQDRIVETDAKLAALLGSVKKIPNAVDDASANAAGSLGKLGAAATEAAGDTKKAGTEAEKAGENMEYGSKKGKQFALSLYEVSAAAMEMTLATNRLAGTALFTGAINRVTARINEQGDALRNQVDELKAANAEFDELAGRRKELSQKFNLLGAGEIEKLLQAEVQLEANRQRSADKRKSDAEQAARATEQAAEAQRAAATDAAKTVAAIAPPVLTVAVPPAETGRAPLELILKVDATGAAAASALVLTQAHIQQINRALLPMLIAELERRRMASR